MISTQSTHGLEKLLSTPEVADLCGVSPERVRDMCRRRLIPFVKLGRIYRFQPSAIRTWIEEGGKEFPGGWRQEPEANA